MKKFLVVLALILTCNMALADMWEKISNDVYITNIRLANEDEDIYNAWVKLIKPNGFYMADVNFSCPTGQYQTTNAYEYRGNKQVASGYIGGWEKPIPNTKAEAVYNKVCESGYSFVDFGDTKKWEKICSSKEYFYMKEEVCSDFYSSER